MPETLTQTEPAEPPAMAPPTLRQTLEQQFADCELVRSFRRGLYDAGHVLDLSVTGVLPANTGRVAAEIEKFVGGGFAGQVYRVKIIAIEPDGEPIAGLTVGEKYAIKILKPPSGFACLFRNFLYFLAYQSPFSAEVNPDSVRVGVLWQKLIRRAGLRKFGTEQAVCDTFATFYDPEMHSFGEINEWVTGRVWKFEVDDELFRRRTWDGTPPEQVNSPEYLSKKVFMRDLVALLHEMGASELARQYEWWTCKSQPNALKRVSEDDSPLTGTTAIDFRAGLALLPFAPMSPADVWLIIRGLAQGRLVQFDRSDMPKLRRFIAERREDFEDLQSAIEELEEKEPRHRASMPDITHNHVRLLTDSGVRRAAREGTISAWKNLGRIDGEHAERLRERPVLFSLLFTVSIIPLLGPLVVGLWGNARTRAHVGRALTSGSYLWRAMRGARIETLINWHRQGRACDERTLKLVHRPVRYWIQRILVGWMPPVWHRTFTEPAFARERVVQSARFMLQFLRDPPFREQWLLDQVRLGCEEGMLSTEEAQRISDQVQDPYIQKYLKCLAVHICTVPVTQVVMVIAGAAVALYLYTVREASWGQAVATGTATGALIQLMPISPGSIARGLFVLYLMIKERDVKNYYIAAPVSFVHVIGYLAFPLQMVAHDPALARFMAGRWATGAVRFIPVFGEHGGLPEHAVFDLFFNLPLSLRRSFKERPVATSIGVLIALAVAAVVIHSLVVIGLLAYARIIGWMA